MWLIGGQGKNFGDVDVKTATDYSAEDSEVTYKLDQPVIGALEGKVKKIYEVIDRPSDVCPFFDGTAWGLFGS